MWEQIAANRRRSIFVVAAMGVILVATGLALGTALTGHEGGALLGGAVALLVWLVLWITAVTRGDAILLKLSGAREIRRQDHPQLLNVVEEMTIAAMLPKPPRVFVIEDRSLNAFATGREPGNAAVTVTTGLLAKLDRDELQGVVAHEIGHIKNRDIALMTTAGIMLGAIVMLSEFGARMLYLGGGRRSRSSSGGGGANLAVMILAILFMLLAPIMAQLLYLALSRRREYLADASGAMFTRYPEGLASALEKISGSTVAMRQTSRVTAPMYIAKPRAARGGSTSSLFSTHPPIKERIHILRTMAGGCDFRAYDDAFRQVKGDHVVGDRTLAETKSVAAREASPAGGVAAMAAIDRHRAANDALLHAEGYKWIECGCGATMKVPPAAVSRLSNCPRCGRSL